ncbi:MAG: hypothetical protein HND51_18425, partial [Chloroflexi bacterium]|nr:hypothetical protein [Chloroflexota bacterium]NOH13619.1 hypothetical protein [Chloroflexota bacterium]
PPPTATFTPLPTDAPTLPPTATPGPDDWQAAPITPASISERAMDIYLQGLAAGNNQHAFAKVGDCGGTPSWFLGPFDGDAQYYNLGEYTYLSEMFPFYEGSFERTSVATNPGFNTASVFAPLWADPNVCNADEGPLQCEYRLHNPSVVLIMLGTNDQYKPEEFEASMREIIEFSIAEGILPILGSKADNLEGDGSINSAIYQLALEYELPYWNFWRAVQGLPNNGLQEDEAHLTWAPNFFDQPRALNAGWPQRNLTALQALHAVFEAIPDELKSN